MDAETANIIELALFVNKVKKIFGCRPILIMEGSEEVGSKKTSRHSRSPTLAFGINERITDTGIIGDVMYIICTYSINKISKKNNLDLLSEDGFWICEKEAEAAAVRRGEIQYQLFI